MKKLMLGIFTFFIGMSTTFAQVDATKAVGKATKALSAYFLDQNGNGDKLIEAVEMIEVATASDETNKSAKTWLKAGEIYNALAQKDVIALTIDPTHKIQNAEAGIKAFGALQNAMSMADKKFQKKEALKYLQETANFLANIGNALLGAKDYTNAYSSLNTILDINKIQADNGMKVTLANESDMNDHKFVTAYCAMAADKKDEARAMFGDLIDAEYEEPRIYAYGFNLAQEAGDDNALAILDKGSVKYPEDQEILFAKINYYIQKEDYVQLTGMLEKAIQNSPDNPSVYSALGNVYMNLFQDEYTANGDSEKANGYYAKSNEYYESALKLDDNMFDVIYSIGSLRYNKAVEISKAMADLPLSENKKFDMLKSQSEGLFNEALPYFKKAEAINPNDINTLIALKEIFARNNDFEKSGEFKKRLETAQGGGKNTPYFNK